MIPLAQMAVEVLTCADGRAKTALSHKHAATWKAARAAGETPPTILTKWCPLPGKMTSDVVRAGVETALERLQVQSIDVMQSLVAV